MIKQKIKDNYVSMDFEEFERLFKLLSVDQKLKTLCKF